VSLTGHRSSSSRKARGRSVRLGRTRPTLSCRRAAWCSSARELALRLRVGALVDLCCTARITREEGIANLVFFLGLHMSTEVLGAVNKNTNAIRLDLKPIYSTPRKKARTYQPFLVTP